MSLLQRLEKDIRLPLERRKKKKMKKKQQQSLGV